MRALVHAADPEIRETIKRTRKPYFVLQGNVCALLAAKDHVNIFLYDGGIVSDPEGIITSGHNNKTGRTVAVYQAERIASARGADRSEVIQAIESSTTSVAGVRLVNVLETNMILDERFAGSRDAR